MTRTLFLSLALSVGLASVVSAQASTLACPPDNVGCYAEDADWVWRDSLFDTIDYDTGWVPASSPLQVRLTFHLAGETAIDMGGTPTTSWAPPLEVRVPGRDGTGLFVIDYGMEIRAFFRFDVRVAGIRYTFENEIDIPVLPMDLRFYDELMFDPFLLPDADPVRVEDRTEPFPLVSLDLGSFVGIPGIGGGLRIDAIGEMRASYQSTAIVIRDASPILMESGVTVVGADEGETGFGGSKDLLIHPEGLLNYEGSIIFSPAIFLDVLGRGFDFPLAEVPIDIVSLMNDVIFDDVLVHVPLPDIALSQTSLDFGDVFVGESTMLLLRVENEGEALLGVDLGTADGFTLSTTHLDIPPMSSSVVEVTFAPTTAGPVSTSFWIASNDPDESMVLVRLSGNGLEMAMPDAGVMPDAGFDAGTLMPPGGGGCGCRSTGDSNPAGLGLILIVLGLIHRRRH